MALAETAELAVKLSLGGNFVRQMGQVNKSLGKFEKGSSRAFRAGQQIGTGIKRGAAIAAGGVAFLASQVAFGLDSLVELEQQTAQTNAVIKSTGGVAGITAAKVGELAEKYESLNATIGDEVIREGQNLLLTFTNITGKGFEPALQAALDLNTGLGKGPGGLTNSVKLVGKALNDPTKGLGALSKAGITFSKEQIKRIKGLQKEGKLYEAQGIILAELEKRFGGRFLAEGGTTGAKVAKFHDAIEDLQRTLAAGMLPVVSNVADALSELLQDPAIQKGVEDLGREIGNLFSVQNVKAGAKLIGDVFRGIRDAAPAIKTALGTIGTVLKTAFDAFTSLPEPIQKLLIGGFAVNKLTGGLVTNIAGGIFGALKAMTVQAAVVNVTGGVVNGPGGLPGAAGKGLGIGAILGGLALTAVAAAAVFAVQQHISGQNTAFSEDIKTDLDKNIEKKSTAELQYALDGVNQGIRDLQSNPLNVLVSGDALANLQAMKASLEAALGRNSPNPDRNDRDRSDVPKNERGRMVNPDRKDDGSKGSNKALPGALDGMKQKLAKVALEVQRKGEQTINATGEVEAAANETKRETTRGAQAVAASTRSGASSVVAAIYANRPIITVNVSATSITQKNVVTGRYGPPSGSRNGNGTGHAPGTGPLP